MTGAAAAHRAIRKYQLRRDSFGWLASLDLGWLLSIRTASLAENLVDFLRQLEIVVADAFHAVRGQVDDYLVPHVEPLGVVVHSFSDQRHASHVPECRHKIL